MRVHPLLPILAGLLAAASSCARSADSSATPAAEPSAGAPVVQADQAGQAGQAMVKDDDSQKDVVKVAVGSPDHTTLVKALQAADLVNSLANAGPFTVFAPTNAAFDKLPKGTLDDLLKPENKEKLRGILQHHVTVPALEPKSLADGQTLSMVDGGSVKVSRRGADLYIGDAKVVGSVRASNGMVYILDAVLVPK